jgi:hypothetical protein
MFETRLPQPPTLRKTLGPSFILLGLSMGSGELLLWPYLAATYGLGLLWGAVIGLTLQFVLNTEAMRYTLAWGESVFVGFQKLHPALPIWFIFSTLIPWSLPGFSSATAQILHTLFPPISETFFAIALLLLTGLILSSGSSLYKTMERFQKFILFFGLSFIFFITLLMTRWQDWVVASKGLVGIGENWWLLPPGLALATFLRAFAYSGAGGNLNLAQSYYIKEKGFGMGKYMGKISALFSSKKQKVDLFGQHFAHTKDNARLWKHWWQLINREHMIVFWGLGLLSIIVLSTLAYATSFGQTTGTGLEFLYFQASTIGKQTLPIFHPIFLLVGASMLFASQTGVLESSSRIISENSILATHLKHKKVALASWFYIALWTQIGLGIVTYLIGFRQPLALITLAAILNAIAMMVSFALLFLLNRQHLLRQYQPHRNRKIILIVATVLFGFFLVITILDLLK